MFMERMLTGPSLKGSMCVLAINSIMSKHVKTILHSSHGYIEIHWCHFSVPFWLLPGAHLVR